MPGLEKMEPALVVLSNNLLTVKAMKRTYVFLFLLQVMEGFIRLRQINSLLITSPLEYSCKLSSSQHGLPCLSLSALKHRRSTFTLLSKIDNVEEENVDQCNADGEKKVNKYNEEQSQPPLDKIRLRGRVAYDGTRYKGWQVQSKGRTVQGELQKALSKRFNRRISIIGAGRTDSGVHARGQAFQFDLYEHEIQRSISKTIGADNNERSTKKYNRDSIVFNDCTDKRLEMKMFLLKLEHTLNCMLHIDTHVWNLSIAPPPSMTEYIVDDNGSIKDYNDDLINDNEENSNLNPKNEVRVNGGTLIRKWHKWHVIYRATKKLYCYRLCIASPTTIESIQTRKMHKSNKNMRSDQNLSRSTITMYPTHRYTRAQVNYPIDLRLLEKVLKYYIGTHDFRAFAGAIEANQRKAGVEHKNTVRTVYNITLVYEGIDLDLDFPGLHSNSSTTKSLMTSHPDCEPIMSGGYYRIEFLLKGALYKMVRNMVGTALEVARGNMEEDRFLELLHHDHGNEKCNTVDCSVSSDGQSKSLRRKQFVRKDNKSKPAPPEGLTLEMVYFDEENF
mmetsp:Transcript_19265/g.27101  ORF Transcript_19265/g.27101 Transcript_19265/m.27101 type:complete len:559 (-) Transcript_19265:8-1684(-)